MTLPHTKGAVAQIMCNSPFFVRKSAFFINPVYP